MKRRRSSLWTLSLAMAMVLAAQSLPAADDVTKYFPDDVDGGECVGDERYL